jgi:hypothetical protein
MKAMVVAGSAGVWLAEHLNCGLLTESSSGQGIVHKFDVKEPLPDYCDHYLALSPTPQQKQLLSGVLGRVVGWSPLSDKLEKVDMARPILGAYGLDLATQEGLPFGVMGWWGGQKWEGKAVLVVEQMGFMNRDLGVGLFQPQGVCIIPISYGAKLMEQSLGGLSSLLLDSDYVGPVCLRMSLVGRSLMVRYPKAGFVPGWLEPILELQIGNLLEQPFNLRDNCAVGLHVSVPPYPYEQKIVTDRPIGKLYEAALKHLRLQDVSRSGTEFMSCGGGSLFYSTAWGVVLGDDPREARLRVYRGMRSLDIPDVQYRTDASSTMQATLEQLRLLGWL